MFKKIRTINKIIKFVDAIDNYFKGHKNQIATIKEMLPKIKEYISDAERILKKGGK